MLAHEWPLYIFDAVLMAVSLAICIKWYVGDIVSKTASGGVYVMMDYEREHRG